MCIRAGPEGGAGGDTVEGEGKPEELAANRAINIGQCHARYLA